MTGKRIFLSVAFASLLGASAPSVSHAGFPNGCLPEKDPLEDASWKLHERATGFTREDYLVNFYGYIEAVGEDHKRGLTRADIEAMEQMALKNDGQFSRKEMGLLLGAYEELRQIRTCHPHNHRCRMTVVQVATPESDAALRDLVAKYDMTDVRPIHLKDESHTLYRKFEDEIRVAINDAIRAAVRSGDFETTEKPTVCLNDLYDAWLGDPETPPSDLEFYAPDGTVYQMKQDGKTWLKFRFRVDDVVARRFHG